MRRPLLLIAGALLVAFAAAYFGSPYFAARTLREAARSVDAAAIDAGVDFPAVRDSLKSQLNAAIARKMAADPNMKSNPFAGLGMMMAPAIVDRMVDSFVTPDGIAALARGQKPNAPKTEAKSDVEYSYSWVNLDRFRIRLRTTAQAKDGPSLLFERRGLFTWKLIRIEIADLLDDATTDPTPAASTPPPTVARPTLASPPASTGKLSTTIDPAASNDDLKTSRAR